MSTRFVALATVARAVRVITDPEGSVATSCTVPERACRFSWVARGNRSLSSHRAVARRIARLGANARIATVATYHRVNNRSSMA